MITIRLTDARQGLYQKCRELLKDERIAEDIYKFLCDGIEDCENVQPQKKRGEWIDCKTLPTHWKCSVCGERAPFWVNWQTHSEWLSDFCPNCGSDMRETE